MKNIAALLREDARTVHVRFGAAGIESRSPAVGNVIYAGETVAKQQKTYTYVTSLPLAVNDVVLVPAADSIKLAHVVQVDGEAVIDPTDEIGYAWVICRVDRDAYIANMKRNAEIEQAVAEARRVNVRRNFAEQVLAGLDLSSRSKLAQLTGTPTPPAPPAAAAQDPQEKQA